MLDLSDEKSTQSAELCFKFDLLLMNLQYAQTTESYFEHNTAVVVTNPAQLFRSEKK